MQLIILFSWNGEVRTMKFNRNGCEIRGLFYKKIYKWSEIKSIKYGRKYCNIKFKFKHRKV